MPPNVLAMFQQGASVVSIRGREWHSVGLDEALEMLINAVQNYNDKADNRLHQQTGQISTIAFMLQTGNGDYKHFQNLKYTKL